MKPNSLKRSRFALALLATTMVILVAPAAAEKADRRKPAIIDSAKVEGDNKNKAIDFLSKVTITQGTLKIVADKGEIRGDVGSYKANLRGSPVCFRQKKDGKDEYLRGQAQRMEYDQAKERIDFFGQVVTHDGLNEMRGEHVIYSMASEQFSVIGAEKPGSEKSVVRMILVPKEVDEGEAEAAPVALNETLDEKQQPPPKPRLKTSKEIEAGRYEPLASKCIKEAL